MAQEDVKTVAVHMENLNDHPQCAHGDYYCGFVISCVFTTNEYPFVDKIFMFN